MPGLPTSLQPYAKFITPAVMAIVAAVIHGVLTDAWDRTELEVLTMAFFTATLAFAIKNGSSGLQRYAKALGPFALTAVGVLLHGAFTGEFDRTELATAITGVASALVTFAVPNGAHEETYDSDPLDDDGRTTLGVVEGTAAAGRGPSA